jgi:hypothetical protein
MMVNLNVVMMKIFMRNLLKNNKKLYKIKEDY